MPDRTDPRITRTAQALEQAIVELASQRPVSQITVADLADRAGVTRATFYNRYSSPLDLLIQVLYADLELSQRSRRRLRARLVDLRASAILAAAAQSGHQARDVRLLAGEQHVAGNATRLPRMAPGYLSCG